ncbi:hypothetical protein NDU88_006573 [Pleurodeles waltl]|uniref:Uncharacterized protein n=1 Tax=Pleurodeles waltl TaxID=8319 RepID=A0AAV7TY69_PLEWA|nr:hypothetical protein NDU88_006573 [Pleurodeles waltl]
MLWAPAAPRPRGRRLPSLLAPNPGHVRGPPAPARPQLTSGSSSAPKPLPGPPPLFPTGRCRLRSHPRRGPVYSRSCACTQVPGFSGRIRPPAPESPTPSGSARQRPEQLPYAFSGSPALWLRDARG